MSSTPPFLRRIMRLKHMDQTSLIPHLTRKVEAITQHKKYGRKVKGEPQCYKFLVKWEEYPTSVSLWKPEENLKGTQEILTKYKKLHKLCCINTRHLHCIRIRTSQLAISLLPTCPTTLKKSFSSSPTPLKFLA